MYVLGLISLERHLHVDSNLYCVYIYICILLKKCYGTEYHHRHTLCTHTYTDTHTHKHWKNQGCGQGQFEPSGNFPVEVQTWVCRNVAWLSVGGFTSLLCIEPHATASTEILWMFFWHKKESLIIIHVYQLYLYLYVESQACQRH